RRLGRGGRSIGSFLCQWPRPPPVPPHCHQYQFLTLSTTFYRLNPPKQIHLPAHGSSPPLPPFPPVQILLRPSLPSAESNPVKPSQTEPPRLNRARERRRPSDLRPPASDL